MHNCTPDQKLACFVLYLKIVNTFFENWYMHLIVNCPRNSKIALNLSKPSSSWVIDHSNNYYTAKLLMYYVVTVLWLDSDDVVTILLPTSGTSGRLQNCVSVPPWFLNGNLLSSHVVTVQLPIRCLVDRFLCRSHGSGYLITCVSDVVTVQ